MAMNCAYCGRPLSGKRADAVYCSSAHRLAAHRHPDRVARPDTPPRYTVTVRPVGWLVEGWVPTGWVADVGRLHDELEERHGGPLSDGLEVEMGGRVAHIRVEFETRSHASEFARAVNEILGDGRKGDAA